MKKFLLLCLLFVLSVPVFAVPGEYITLESGLVVCDVSDVQQLRQKLEKEFYENFENYKKTGFIGNAYNREVDLPVYKLLEQKRKAGHCGFARY